MRSLASLLAAALLLACARDLDVPPETTAPRISSFSPASAYAGEWLTITGSGFDADPQGNLVQFARASARSESAGAGSISVRVPADAGAGPLTVTTKGGISDPSSSFSYRGLGELRTRVASGEIPLLHKPYRVLPTRDDTYLHSDLLLGVLRYGDPTFVAASAWSADAAPWMGPDGSVVRLDSGEEDSTLVLDMGVGGTRSRPIAYAGIGPVVAVRAEGGLSDSVAAVLRQEGSGWTVALHGLSDPDLAPLAGWPDPESVGTAQPLPDVADLLGCVDAGGGDLACLARRAAGAPLKLARVRLVPAPAVQFLDPPEGTTIVENGFLDEDPLCADHKRRRAVVALGDGRIAAADVAGAGFLPPVATGSRTPARSLGCIASDTLGTQVLVAKLADDLLVKLDALSGKVDWSVALSKVSHARAWCDDATCNTGVVHAAGEADNRAFVLDMGDGSLIALRSFDVLPGRVDDPDALLDLTGVQGAARYAYGSDPDVPWLSFPTAAPRGTIWMPVTAKRGSGLYPHFAPSDAVAVVPGVTGAYRMVLDDAAFAGVPLTATAQLGLDAPDPYAHAATDAGLETIDYGLGAVTAVSPLASPRFTSLGRLPDGRIHASVRSGSQWSVRAWETNGAADPFWTSPGAGARMVASSAVLDGALWAFYWDASDELHAVALSSSLTARSDSVLADAFYSILAVSPNGRTFVSWDFQPYVRDTSVVVWSADAAAGFPRLATIPVEGQVAGAAFDGSGEALYVVTRGPDRVVVIE